MTGVPPGGEIDRRPFSCFTVALRAGDVVARCQSTLFFCHHCVTHQSARALFVFMRRTSCERPASSCISSAALAADQMISQISSHACASLCDRPCSAVSKKTDAEEPDVKSILLRGTKRGTNSLRPKRRAQFMPDALQSAKSLERKPSLGEI